MSRRSSFSFPPFFGMIVGIADLATSQNLAD